MSHALDCNLAAYHAARELLATVDHDELATIIRDEHERRGMFGRTSAILSAALDEDAARTAAHHAEVHAVDAEAHGPDAWKVPTSGVSTDRYRDHLAHYAVNGPSVGLVTDCRSGNHIGTAPAPSTDAVGRPADPSDPRFRVHVTTGGSLLDGYAYMVASHKLADDGVTEYESPHTVRVGVIAQPGDPTAHLSQPVHWYGRTMANWDPTLSAADDAVMSGRQADNATSGRRAGRALDRWTPGAEGTNGTHNGQPVRWRNLTARAAQWLHAVNGTECPADILDTDPQRIVGAIPVEPLKTRRRHSVAIDIVQRTPQGQRRSVYHRQPDALDHHGRWNPPTRILVNAQPHTARSSSVRQDKRRGRDNTSTLEGRKRITAKAAAQQVKRRRDGMAAAVECIALGTWPSGRSDASQVQAAAVIALVSSLCPMTGEQRRAFRLELLSAQP